jgi:adenosine deaminase
VFETTLSQEYLIATRTFNLTLKEIWDFSCKSLDYALVSTSEREHLKEIWKEWEKKMQF